MIRVGALLAFLIPVMAWAQASVDESKESAFIYVDTAVGSDSNPGTQSLPLKTISAAVSIAITNNVAGIGTRVIINPGVYREAIVVSPSPNQTSAPMTFQAGTNGTVFVSGAVQYTNWATDTQIAARWSRPALTGPRIADPRGIAVAEHAARTDR